jgi:hypothetical protein
VANYDASPAAAEMTGASHLDNVGLDQNAV